MKIFGTDYPTPDGTAVRDYVHVMDLADAHLRALDRLQAGTPSQAINLGTGRGHSVKEVVDAVARVGGTDGPAVESAAPAGRSAGTRRGSRPARATCWAGPASTPTLETIVQHAWTWHEQHH